MAIAPQGADVDQPEQVVDRWEPYSGSPPAAKGGVGGLIIGAIQARRDNSTLGFRHQEWIIRPGAHLYVQGEASDATGQLAFAKPDGGRYMISTRTEEQIVQSAQRFARVGSRVSTVAGIVGGVLVFAGLLTG